MTKRMWLSVGAVAIAAAAVAYYQFAAVEAEAPTLRSVEATRGAVVSTVEATGRLEAVVTVQVGSQVSGSIKTLYADFNSTVSQGQIIAELDPSLFATQVEQAEATVARLEAEVERAKIQATDADIKLRRTWELFEKHLVPENDLETAESDARMAGSSVTAAEAQVEQARASLNQAQVNLSHTVIRAPIDGVVIARNVDIGQTVAASMSAPTLFVLAQDLGQMRVNASIDESDIGNIQPGQSVQFRVDAYPTETFSGVVSQVRLEPEVSQNVVSYVTIIDVPNPNLPLKPGMTASVSIETARTDDVVRVPNAALRFQPTEEVFAALGQTLPGGPDVRAGDDREPGANGRGTAGGETDRAPEQRTAQRERMEQMSPEERAQMRAGSAEAGRGQAPAPVAGEDDRAVVWVLDEGALRRVPVRTGISDGTQTAVVGGGLESGSPVVTGVLTGTAAAAATTSSPLLPTGRRGGLR
jgi:HlyD family secretion protein